MRKIIAKTIVCILAVMMLAACGKKEEAPPTGNEVGSGKEGEADPAFQTDWDKKILLDAGRMKNFEVDQENYLQTFSVLWDGKTFSFQEKNDWKVRQTGISLKRLSFSTALLDGNNNPIAATVQADEWTGIETGNEVYEECFDEETDAREQKFEKIDKTTFFKVEKEESGTTYLLYKLLKRDTEASAEDQETEGGENDKYAGYDVVSIEIYAAKEDAERYTEKEFLEELSSLSECVTYDSGAPYLQDIVCYLHWGGISIKDCAIVSQMYQEEGNNEFAVAIDKEAEFPEKEIFVSYCKYGEGNLEGTSYEKWTEKGLRGGQEEITLLGRKAIYDTEYEIIHIVGREGIYSFQPVEGMDRKEAEDFINQYFTIE